MNTILKVQHLSKEFDNVSGRNAILNDIDFELMEGDFVAIMGPSGSGKSTFLNMISGMDRPTTGEVYFFNKSITKLNDKQMASFRLEKVGFVYQRSALLDTLCLFDNVVLPAYTLKKEKRNTINNRAKFLMEKMGIENKASDTVSHLSGGQLQRGCICRAMINKPEILFADEPTGALNSQASEQVMASFESIHADGTTILLVTHDPRIAAYASKVVYLSDGKITKELRFDADINADKRNRLVSEWIITN